MMTNMIDCTVVLILFFYVTDQKKPSMYVGPSELKVMKPKLAGLAWGIHKQNTALIKTLKLVLGWRENLKKKKLQVEAVKLFI